MVDEAKDNADDFERLLNMDSEMPDHFDEAPRRSSTRMEEEADRKHDAMANVAGASRVAQRLPDDQLGELELEPELAAMAERIISSLDASDGGYLRVQPGGSACRRTPEPTSWSWPGGRWRWCRTWIRPGWPHATCANACCCS